MPPIRRQEQVEVQEGNGPEKKLSWRQNYYAKLASFAFVGLGLIGIATEASLYVIDRGRETAAEQITDLANKADQRIDPFKEGFKDAKTRFDAAIEQCEVIKGVAPDVSAIAGALNDDGATELSGTTTTSTLPTPQTSATSQPG